MIELVVEDNKTFDSLVQESTYHSSITHVMAFSDDKYSVLNSMSLLDGTVYKKVEVKKRGKVYCIKEGNREIIFVQNANNDLLSFLGINSADDPWLPYDRLLELSICINQKIVDLDPSFSDRFSSITFYRGIKVNDLVTSNYISKDVGNIRDYIDMDITPINYLETYCRDRDVKYRRIKAKVLYNGVRKSGERNVFTRKYILEDSGENKYLYEKFGFFESTRSERECLEVGNEVCLIYQVGDDEINPKLVYLPETNSEAIEIKSATIIPDDLNFRVMKNIKNKTRKIPLNLNKALAYEIYLRGGIKRYE